MARIHYVKKARKDQGSCVICHKPIEAGMPYKWTAPRSSKASSGYKKKAHSDCPFRPSHTMSSPNLGAIADAQDDFQTAIGQASSAEELTSAGEALAEAIREVGEAYGESADAVEEGFGHSTYVSEEIREKADGCEAWADEIESAAQDIEEFDEDSVREEVAEEVAQDDDIEDDDKSDAIEEAVSEKRDAWLDEQREALEDAAGNQPF